MSEKNIDKNARRCQSFFFVKENAAGDMEKSLAKYVMEVFGGIDGKYAVNISLASHVFNVTLIGLNTFIYDTVAVKGNDITDIEPDDIRLLIAATVLHDVNKYLGHESNTRKTLEEYFQDVDDPLHISDYLAENKIEELLWLIQRTEVYENSSESRGSPPQNRDLKRYCRIGDAVASRITKDSLVVGKEYLANEYTFSEDHNVHLKTFTALEQPILNALLLAGVKSQLQSENAIVLGSSNDSLLYLASEPIIPEVSEIVEHVEKEIDDRFSRDFSPDVTWRYMRYGSLSEVQFSIDEKIERLSEALVSVLEGGPAGEEPIESVPKEFRVYLPYAARALFKDEQESFADELLQERFDQLSKEKSQGKEKILLLLYLATNYEKHETILQRFKQEQEMALKNDLNPDSKSLNSAAQRFLNQIEHDDQIDKQTMCFLCGTETADVYQSGFRSIFGGAAYSKRTAPVTASGSEVSKMQKKICEACHLENILTEAVCGGKSNLPHVQQDVHIEFAYFYYDEFIPDVALFDDLESNLIEEQGKIDEPSFEATSLFSLQYHLQPFRVSDKNSRMQMIKRILNSIEKTGLKCRVGKPFTRFESSKPIFHDEEALRQQVILGMDEIHTFSDLGRPLELCSLIESLDYDGYLDLDADNFPALSQYVVTKASPGEYRTPLLAYVKKYHDEEFLLMRKIAQRGLDLFGEGEISDNQMTALLHSPKHSKTKTFRTALDSYLRSKSKGWPAREVDEYMLGQTSAEANRERYAGHVSSDAVRRFTDAIKEYLEEQNLDDIKILSDWQNALTNTYLYAIDDILEGENNVN